MSPSPIHALLLLSDSALPLGSFAFSAGLESHLSHAKQAHRPPPSLPLFLHHSLSNQASTQLPFVLAGYRSPTSIADLDDTLDAATPCVVARRASAAQGRALAGLWTRALRSATSPSTNKEIVDAVDGYVADLRSAQAPTHLAPLWGGVCAALALDEWDAAYVFLLSHAKAVVSAGVRAGVMGPYQGQALLASEEVRGWIEGFVRREMEGMRSAHDDNDDHDVHRVAHAGVSVPAMDLWMGRHELLYSRIFNS
ncbi:hypothetical protein ANO11243_047070 [Dothideomycetidae sp. 11243]|nr:hypothetical protein ANO11243_047070 [fungal sp. No.11243]